MRKYVSLLNELICKCNRNRTMELETLIAECTAYDYKDTLEEKKPKRDKDELKPMFKSTPTQFQTTIYASSDEPEIEDVPKDVPKGDTQR